MKKIFAFMAAGLLLTACGDDDIVVDNTPITPTIPLDQVTVQPGTADHPTLDVPGITSAVYNPENASIYTVTYEGGQQLVFTVPVKDKDGNYAANASATLTKIGGTSEKVVIPASLNLDGTEIPVTGLKLTFEYPHFSDVVKTLVIPNTIKGIHEDFFTGTLSSFPSLERVEIEDGQESFASIDGAVYSYDLLTFVFCPAHRSGSFSIAEGTETVLANAFNPEGYVERIVVPASVREIQNEAMLFNEHLQVINFMGTEPPTAPEFAFGFYARRATLVIPQGTKAKYILEKPVVPEVPVEPVQEDFGDDVEAYQVALAAYNEKRTAYNEARAALLNYANYAGYSYFVNVSEVSY